MANTYVAPTITTSGTTLAQLQAGGFGKVLDNLIAANPALANPTTQATAAPTGGGATGGLLPAGNYLLAYTFVGRGGETTIGTSESASVTVGATNIPRVTLPALPTGADYINLYATVAGGASGSEVLYAGGITATTYDMASATYADSARTVPAANDTGLSAHAPLLNAARHGDYSKVFNLFTGALDNFNRGYGVSFGDTMKRLNKFAYIYAAMLRAVNDTNALIWANPGTLTTTTPTTTGMGWPTKVRTQP